MTPAPTTPRPSPGVPAPKREPLETPSALHGQPFGTIREVCRQNQSDVDPETGTMRPIPDEEWQARQTELTRRLTEIDAADDTPDEVLVEFMRNLDEERRRQGRPPAFEHDRAGLRPDYHTGYAKSGGTVGRNTPARTSHSRRPESRR